MSYNLFWPIVQANRADSHTGRSKQWINSKFKESVKNCTFLVKEIQQIFKYEINIAISRLLSNLTTKTAAEVPEN